MHRKIASILSGCKPAFWMHRMQKNVHSSFLLMLSTTYQMTDLGPIRQFLGLQISGNRALHQIELHQSPYIRTCLTRFQMSDWKGISTPIEPNCYLPPCANDTDISNRSEYQSKIGSIMYEILETRPDLAYTISTLSKHNDRPTQTHHIDLQRVFRYLK